MNTYIITFTTEDAKTYSYKVESDGFPTKNAVRAALKLVHSEDISGDGELYGDTRVTTLTSVKELVL